MFVGFALERKTVDEIGHVTESRCSNRFSQFQKSGADYITAIHTDELTVVLLEERQLYFRPDLEARADIAVVTSLSGHFCIRELEAISPLPTLNALPALDRHFERQGIGRVGLLGTRTVMQSKLYGGIASAEVVFPQGNDLDMVHDTYIAMATAVSATEQQRELLVSIGEKLCREQGADAVALAGTDLFLAFDGVDCGYRVVDCARVHIDDIVAHAIGREPR